MEIKMVSVVKIALYGVTDFPKIGAVICEVLRDENYVRAEPGMVFLGIGEYQLPDGYGPAVSGAGLTEIFGPNDTAITFFYNCKNRRVGFYAPGCPPESMRYLDFIKTIQPGERVLGRPGLSKHRLD